MAYVIGHACIGVKDTACVDACPSDSIHSLEDSPQYYIEPETCIDCDACVPACPVNAIFPGDQVPADQQKFVQISIDFFKGFDKSQSSSYKRTKKTEGSGADATASETPPPPAQPNVAKWEEVSGWEASWEKRKDDLEDRLERDKRYGYVHAIYEQDDKYTIRFFLPEATPNHPFRFRYGLPDQMCGYDVKAKLKGNVAHVTGVIRDPNIRKLAGFTNSFPDRFFVELSLAKKVSSISVKPQSTHTVDVVAIKVGS